MLKKLNLINILIISVVARIVLKGAGIGDAVALLPLASIYCYQEYLASLKVVSLSSQVEAELSKMRSDLNAIKIAKAYGKL